jgi:hypothetical protein
MRKAALTLSLLFVASITVARADISNSAPADEYFGPSQQSVLEIRNRLNDYDQRDPGAMLDPEVTSSLDHLEGAILDWQHKYPGDPWLPEAMSHLMREYWRAGQASGDHGMAALGVMRTAYPDSPATLSTIAMVYGSNSELSEIARDGNEPIQREAPIAAAVPALPSYAMPAPVADEAPAPVAVPDPMPDAVPVAQAPARAPAPEVVSASDQPLPSYAIPRADVGLTQAPSAQTSHDSNGDPPYVTMPQDAVPTPPPTR